LSTNKQTLSLYWIQIRKHKLSFFTALIAIPTAALLLDTLLPYVLSLAIGHLVTNNMAAIQPLLIWAGLAAIVGVSLNLLGFQFLVRHEARVRTALTDNTFQRLITKDYDFFSNQKIGALTSKFIDFINAHVMLQDIFIMRTLTFSLTTLIGIGLIFSSSPLLGFILIGLVIGILIEIKIMMRIREPYRNARKKIHAEVNGAAADAITNNLTVKTFAHEKFEQQHLGGYTKAYMKAHIKDLSYLSFEGSSRLLVVASTQILAVFIMASLVASGKVNAGIAIFTLAYLQRFAGQLFNLGELIVGYDRAFLQASPMTEILMSDDTVLDEKGAKNLVIKKGEVIFDRVTYAYSDAKQTKVIDDFSLTIKAGEKIGLVGHSGAGKTTVTRLLLRFSDVNSGKILIDSQDISQVKQQSLRETVAYVSQEPLLFHRTLRENISYGKPDASDDDILEAAKKAHAFEFIKKLEHGLDTVVGERGVKLSGGQRQRIVIARAILKNAPILVLDEATSALDSSSEKLIQAALLELMKDRTAIVIAHRLSTIQRMDRIVVLEDGHIAEQGSHKELLEKNGIYAGLWAHQSGGFLEE
jgi:ATP-binding cassette subfamily B protein